MVEGALWFIGCYAAGMAAVHLYRLLYRDARKAVRYVLITCNNQLQVEWYIRSLLVFHWLEGRPVRWTILDQGSQDDTLPIIRRLIGDGPWNESREDGKSQVTLSAFREDEEVVRVELNNKEDVNKLPLWQ